MDHTNPINPQPEDDTEGPAVAARLEDLAASDPADAPEIAEALADDLTDTLDGVGDTPTVATDAAARQNEPSDLAET
jgi:hypothetical protein